MKKIKDNTETITVIHKDHLGSSSLTTDTKGVVVSNQSYYPYGDTRTSTGENPTRQYTGQINDVDTGLYYYNSRIGRFIGVVLYF